MPLYCAVRKGSSNGDGENSQEEKKNAKRNWLHEEENAIASVVRSKTQSEFPALYVGGIVRVEPILSKYRESRDHLTNRYTRGRGTYVCVLYCFESLDPQGNLER